MKKVKLLICHLLAALLFGMSASAMAGPVIIAGTDADDHGSASATANLTGWLFMQKAFENLAPAVGNGNKAVVCLGCNGGQAQAAYASAASKSALNGAWTFSSLTSLTQIAGFFNGSGAANVNNTGIVYMPTVSGNVDGGIQDDQLAIVNASSAALNKFVLAGGGLFTQEEASSSIGYGWLSSLLPGLVVQGDNGGPGFDSSTLKLTAAGNAAFPGLSSGVMSGATPWHAWFSGDFGGLNALAAGSIFGPGGVFDGAVVIGGGAGTVFQCGDPGQPACVITEPAMLPMLGLGLLSLILAMKRKSAGKENCQSRFLPPVVS